MLAACSTITRRRLPNNRPSKKMVGEINHKPGGLTSNFAEEKTVGRFIKPMAATLLGISLLFLAALAPVSAMQKDTA
jgi:hypothetical protein